MPLVMVVLAGGIGIAAYGAEVYRWVDDRGVTNMSDVVPEKYKAVAQRVEVQAEPDGTAARRPSGAAVSAGAASASASAASAGTASRKPAVPKPSSAGSISPSSDDADCATLQRRFKEAQDCLGPRPHTINGGVNGARAPQCPVVVDPSPRCGLPDNGEGPPAPGP